MFPFGSFRKIRSLFGLRRREGCDEGVNISILCSLLLFPRETVDPGKPLFLTPLVKKNNVKEAREVAKVTPFLGTVESYSGYLTVNEDHGSNLFFWYIVSETKRPPTLIWLNGWSTSSLSGLFQHHGPYKVNSSGEVLIREHSWHKQFNMIYIDNTVGTGFSFTRHHNGYKTDQKGVGKDLYNAITQIFDIFPELLSNDLYIAAVSYGGKFASSLATIIHEKNRTLSPWLKLKGIIMGNPWVDPVSQIEFSQYLYQLGMIGAKDRDYFRRQENSIVELINEGKHWEASQILGDLLLFPHSSFNTITGLLHCYSYVDHYKTPEYWLNFLNFPSTRLTLHVGKTAFSDGSEASEYLYTDFTKSVKPLIEALLEDYKILFYNGQMDVVCGYPMMLKMIESLRWSGAEGLKNADRKPWKFGNKVACYIRRYSLLTEALVRNAGHMATINNPIEIQALISQFIHEDLY